MGKLGNEQPVYARNMGLRYVAEFNASNQVIYEGWADPSALTSEAKFQICKHTYDSSGNLTETNWAKRSGYATDDFVFIWDDRLTYF